MVTNYVNMFTEDLKKDFNQYNPLESFNKHINMNLNMKKKQEFNILEVVIPTDRRTLERQIKALKYIIEHDTRDIDKQIHLEALECLERAYSEI